MEIKIAFAVIYVSTMAVLWCLYMIMHCKAMRDAYENPSFYGERKDNG